MQKEVSQREAVSPVIGVILMVAITVILAAVIGTFVLGLGGGVEEEVRAGVNVDIDSSEENVIITITTMGNADHIILRGQGLQTKLNIGGQPDGVPVFNNTGQSVTLSSETNGEIEEGSGTLTVVGMKGNLEGVHTLWSGGFTGTLDVDGITKSNDNISDQAKLTTIRTVEYDFS